MSNSKGKSSFETTYFSKKQVEFLQILISHQIAPSVPTKNILGTGSAAQEGNFPMVMNTQVQKHN